ncbi:Golgin subfamily A member 1, partial [Danaus plexippus plexippus]
MPNLCMLRGDNSSCHNDNRSPFKIVWKAW